MSSPMMKMMLGLCCCCAIVGTLAIVTATSDASTPSHILRVLMQSLRSRRLVACHIQRGASPRRPHCPARGTRRILSLRAITPFGYPLFVLELRQRQRGSNLADAATCSGESLAEAF